MGKHKYFKFMGFLNISDEAEVHPIPKIWEKVNLHSIVKRGKDGTS